MILSGRSIKEHVHSGDIFIESFSDSQLGPNSYNLRLHETLMVYKSDVLDMKLKHEVEKLTIPKSGFLLKPGELYLARTVERTSTKKFVPMIEGRSSIGRLGLFVHVTAGFGDVGFDGTWTLEITAIKPIWIYPNVQICQIFFHTIDGADALYDSKKYQYQVDPTPSKIWREFMKPTSASVIEKVHSAINSIIKKDSEVEVWAELKSDRVLFATQDNLFRVRGKEWLDMTYTEKEKCLVESIGALPEDAVSLTISDYKTRSATSIPLDD